MHTRFALIVGVSDYRSFDHSAGQAQGTSDLWGPANNVAGALDFCHALGFAAADLAVVASPLVPPRGGHPSLYATATRASVLAGVRLLATRLAASDASQGLIWFSGHGDAVDDVGPVLCVEDTVLRDGRLHNVVSLAEIGALLTELAPGRSVTIILDSCASGTPPAGVTHTLGRLRAAARLRDGDTLIAATGPGQTGVEIQVDGGWRGALSWALTTAIAPYARISAHGFVVPDLSVGDWVTRARLLLAGVSAGQHPQLHGHVDAAVLQPSGVPSIHVTGRLADARRGGIEIYGDETGGVKGNEPVWMSYTLGTSANASAFGTMVETFNTTSTLSYRDAWPWAPTAAWPTLFKMTYAGTSSQGPTVPSNAPKMQAFLTGLTSNNFGTVTTNGDQVFGVTENGVPNVFLAYVLRNPTTGALRWVITRTGYSQRGRILASLPAPGGTGGVMLDTSGDVIWFTQITPAPSTLSSVSLAYVVNP